MSIGQCDTSTWPMWYDLSDLFDTATIWGWYLYFLSVTIIDLLYILCMTSASTHFVSCCLYIDAMCNHINFIAHSLQLNFDEYSNNETDSLKRKAFDDEIPANVQKSILKFVQIHNQ